jgi:ubiquinone biosynthesis protein COQ9
MSRGASRVLVALQQSLLQACKYTENGTLNAPMRSLALITSSKELGDVGASSLFHHVTGKRALSATHDRNSIHSSTYSFVRQHSTQASTNSHTSPLSLKEEILEKALTSVEKYGWTRDSLQQACVDLGISPAAAGALRPGDLVHYFNKKANEELADELRRVRKEELLMGGGRRELLMAGIKARLTLLLPYRHSWAQALAVVLLDPKDVEYSLQNARDTSDIIWRFAGDTSLDMAWYTKRILLGAVLQSAEVYLLTDASLEDTMAYVDRCLGLVHQLN